MFKLLYKPSNISSFKFIDNYKKQNNISKIGHTGTLDPLATGLILVATDNDTKLIEYVKGDNKEYIAEGRLGICTKSLDIKTPILKRKEFNVTKTLIKDTLKTFLSKQLQIPPQVSAKKINGKRAYKLAREGIVANLKKIEIYIHSIELISFENDLFKIKVSVSKGTYIRQLINDIGIKLGTYATLTKLERTKISGLNLSDVNSQIDISKILNIDIHILDKINKDELKKLLDGKEYKTHFKNKTALIYSNIPLAIINKGKPKKVFAQNIKKLLSL